MSHRAEPSWRTAMGVWVSVLVVTGGLMAGAGVLMAILIVGTGPIEP